MRYDNPLTSYRLGSTIYFWNHYLNYSFLSDSDSPFYFSSNYTYEYANDIQEAIFMHTIYLDEDNTLMMGGIFNSSFLDFYTWAFFNIIAISSVPGYCVF